MANELYALLQLEPAAPQEAVRKAYFRALREHTAEKSPGRHQELRQAYAVLGDPTARKEYDTRQHGSGEVGRLLDAGNEAFAADRLPDAERSYKRALALSPESVAAKLQLARVASRQHDRPRAIRLMAELTKMNLDNLEVQSENGWINLFSVVHDTENAPASMTTEHKRMLLAAQTSFDRCIAMEPSNRIGYMGRARIEYYREDFSATEMWARRAVDCDDRRDFEDFDALHLIMESRVLSSQVDKAVSAIEEIRALVPNQVEVRAFAAERLARLGLMLMNAKAFRPAVTLLEACRTIAPEHEGISELVRVNLLAAQGHEELQLLEADNSIPKPVYGLAIWAVASYADEFPSDHEKDQFLHNVLGALDCIPAAATRDALVRIQLKYPHVWQCQDTFMANVQNLAREGAQRQALQPSPSGCFTANTVVITSTGPRPIGLVRQGDIVLGFDPRIGTIWSRVEGVRRVLGRAISVQTNRGVVRVTPDHLFLANGRLLAARDLSPGVTLVASGIGAQIESAIVAAIHSGRWGAGIVLQPVSRRCIELLRRRSLREFVRLGAARAGHGEEDPDVAPWTRWHAGCAAPSTRLIARPRHDTNEVALQSSAERLMRGRWSLRCENIVSLLQDGGMPCMAVEEHFDPLARQPRGIAPVVASVPDGPATPKVNTTAVTAAEQHTPRSSTPPRRSRRIQQLRPTEFHGLKVCPIRSM